MITTLALPPQPTTAPPQGRWQWATSWNEARLASLCLMHLADSGNRTLRLDGAHPWPSALPTISPTPSVHDTCLLRMGRHDALILRAGRILPWPVRLPDDYAPCAQSLVAAAQAPAWSGHIATSVAHLQEGDTATGWSKIACHRAPALACAITSVVKAVLWPALRPYGGKDGPLIVQLYAAHTQFDGTIHPPYIALRGNAPARFCAAHGSGRLMRWTKALGQAVLAQAMHHSRQPQIHGAGISVDGPRAALLYGQSFKAHDLHPATAHERMRAQSLLAHAPLPALT